MRLIFKKLRWRNFLSTGNVWSEIDLTQSSTTLLCGDNGHGKSTFLDAFTYVNWDKPFRNISKTKLSNSINKKNTLVEEEVSIGNVNYLIRRGMKPTIFEIERDGEKFKVPADLGDTQTYLENHILKMGHKLAGQIITLGAATFKPFMKLPAPERRTIIEDLLGIEIFSVMNSIHKDRITANKEAINDAEVKILSLMSKIEMQKRHIASLRTMTSQAQEQKQKNLTEYREKIELLDTKLKLQHAELTKIEPQLEKLQKSKEVAQIKLRALEIIKDKRAKRVVCEKVCLENKTELDKLSVEVQQEATLIGKIKTDVENLANELAEMEPLFEAHKKILSLKADQTEAEQIIFRVRDQLLKYPDLQEQRATNQKEAEDIAGLIAGFEERKRRAENELKFFNENNTCVTCTQPIPEDFKNKIISKNREFLEQANKALSTLGTKKTQNQVKANEIRVAQKEFDKLSQELSQADADFVRTDKELKALPVTQGFPESEIITRKSNLLKLKGEYNRIMEALEPKKRQLVKVETNLQHATETFETLEKELAPCTAIDLDKEFPKTQDVLMKVDGELTSLTVNVGELKSLISANLSERTATQGFIDSLQGELEKLNANIAEVEKNEIPALEATEKQHRDLSKERDRLFNHRAILDAATTLLKDDGAKASVIKRYIPVINKSVNQFLEAMDFSCGFELDENFEETVKSRYRDEFKYDAFSEGEKLRIDLSLLFSWREIAKRRSAASSNLLVMDEVLDRSLDQSGVEGLMRIIAHIKEDTNLFVISHRADQVADLFDRTIRVTKRNNFSSMVDV